MSDTCSITTWNRMEPLPREGSMKKSLQAQVRDPLWMLARQWQVGEFYGDDGGSPIEAAFIVEHQQLTSFRAGIENKVTLFDNTLPLEIHVERGAVELGLRGYVQLGLFLEVHLKKELPSLVDDFQKQYPISETIPDDEIEDTAARQFRMTVAGKVTDGNAVYLDVVAMQNGNISDKLKTIINNAGTDAQKLQNILENIFVSYRESIFSEPLSDDSSWSSQNLDYQFAVGSQSDKGNANLSSLEFKGGHLDWYSFSLTSESIDAGKPDTAITDFNAMIPNHVTFRGMPNQRWWNFEDSQTDFGNLYTEITDLAKMLVTEFALIYGNDWFVLPIKLQLGSLNRVKSLIISDTFGQRTLIRHTEQQVPSGDKPWSMFTISDGSTRSDFLLLAPTLGGVIDAMALEDVHFLRDETAAMGWAVEKTIQGPMDSPVDGYESYLKRIKDNPLPPPPKITPGGPDIYYLLGTTVPDNWIPLVPISASEKTFLFRRGIMEPPLGTPEKRARGKILEPQHPLFIQDQAIPKAGTHVTRYFRRSRWIDGKTYLWMAKKTRNGRGPGWSGLAFDLIKQMGNA